MVVMTCTHHHHHFFFFFFSFQNSIIIVDFGMRILIPIRLKVALREVVTSLRDTIKKKEQKEKQILGGKSIEWSALL
jgi:hypothetical protein